VKSLVFLAWNAACVFPVLLSLDPWTPVVYWALAALFLLLRRPDRVWTLGAALATVALLGWWVFLANLWWTVGVNPFDRAVFLGLRAAALAGISISFALGVHASELLNEAMQLLGLPARWGYALFAALNALPRLRDEQVHLQAVHRVRLGGKASPLVVQAVTMLARAIRSGERAALSMGARGLENPEPRSWFRPVVWTRADALSLGGGLLAAVLAFVFLVAFHLFRFGFY